MNERHANLLAAIRKSAVAGDPPMTLRAMAAHLRCGHTAVPDLLNDLVDDGALVIEVVDNRRRYLLPREDLATGWLFYRSHPGSPERHRPVQPPGCVERACLTCATPFPSPHVGVRMCDRCRVRAGRSLDQYHGDGCCHRRPAQAGA